MALTELTELNIEEPKALQEFHSVNLKVAINVSKAYQLAILYKERDKTDLYGRNQVYWALPKEIVEKLLRCRTELVPKNCFVGEETEIVRCLLVRGWLTECTRNDGAYVGNLNVKTAKTLKRQLSRFKMREEPSKSPFINSCNANLEGIVIPLCRKV